MRDTRLRSWIKSLSWRLLGILILGGISWVYTRDIQQTTIITMTFHTIRLILYYFHERFWEKIKWGRK